MTFDETMMSRALRLAEKAAGYTAPNPMVGAVIVRNGTIIGEGYHHKAGCPHAEIEAIQSAGNQDLSGCTLYVTLEPCCTAGRTPPCTDAIIRNKFARVVVGCTDPNPRHAGHGFELLRSAGIRVDSGVLEKKCLQLNEPFFHYITTGKPLVLLKMACTLDGKTATASGNSQWITGPAARKRVQRLRRFADAVLVGHKTFETDKPALTVRTAFGRILRTPLRLVASRQRLALPEGWERADLTDGDRFLQELGKRHIMFLLVEGGGELAGTMMKQGLIEKIEFHYAPKILCGRNSSTVADGPDSLRLEEAFPVRNMSFKKLGDGFMVTGDVIK